MLGTGSGVGGGTEGVAETTAGPASTIGGPLGRLPRTSMKAMSTPTVRPPAAVTITETGTPVDLLSGGGVTRGRTCVSL